MGRDVDRFDLEGRRVPEELVNDVIRLMARHRSVRACRPDPLPRFVECSTAAKVRRRRRICRPTALWP